MASSGAFVWVNAVGYEVRSKPESGDSGIAMPR